jgi:hypothetical protein
MKILLAKTRNYVGYMERLTLDFWEAIFSPSSVETVAYP